jgi:hypothetical protein
LKVLKKTTANLLLQICTHISNKLYKIVKNAETVALHKLDLQFKKQDKRVKEMFDDLRDIETVVCEK